MIFRFSNIRFVSLSLILLLSACSTSHHQTTQQIETRAVAIAINSNTFSGKTAIIKGEYAPIKVNENLKDSVEQQELPNIWLEFEKENGEIKKVKLDANSIKKLDIAGKSLFNYRFLKNNSDDSNVIVNSAYNHSINFGNALNTLRVMKIDSPDGRRKLTEEEVQEILDKQAGLINDRYFELDDHFKPKSEFYKFKKSINEKFGYQIF